MYVLVPRVPGGRPNKSSSPAYLRTWYETLRLIVLSLFWSALLFGLAAWHETTLTSGDSWAGLPAVAAAAHLFVAAALWMFGARPSWDDDDAGKEGEEEVVVVCHERVGLILRSLMVVDVTLLIAFPIVALTRYSGDDAAAGAPPLHAAAGACGLSLAGTALLFPSDPTEAGKTGGDGDSKYAPPAPPVDAVPEA